MVSDYWVVSSSSDKLFESTDDIPFNKVGLVLGTSKFVKTENGTYTNPYFQRRIEAAHELYKAGKVKYLLVSGDNRTHHYNEPIKMKEDLVKMGVPEEKIIADYAGRRTLDSIIRANKIFGLDACTIISQKFHCQRAVYLANQKEMNVVAYNAQPVNYHKTYWRNRLRESLARVKAVLDITLGTKAQVMGRKETIPS